MSEEENTTTTPGEQNQEAQEAPQPRTDASEAPQDTTSAESQSEGQQGAGQGQQESFDLFDEPSAVKKKAEQKKAQATAQAKAGAKTQSKQGKASEKEPQKKYAAGKELHYSGHKLALPREMTEAEIFTWLADDFPELSSERAEVREDAPKDRLVISLKSFKKGVSPAPR